MSYQQSNFDYQKFGKKVLQIEREGLDQLEQYINSNFSRVCEIIFSCCGKVVLMGMGKSGHIGKKIAATFASTGTPSFFVHPGEASHGDLGMVSSNDVVIAISNSGESNEILTIIPIIKRQNTLLICITSNPESSIGRAADVHLCVKVPKEACPFGLAPTSSSVATLVMGDALAVALLKARGFTKENFVLSHPGGSLSHKSPLYVNDIMHIGKSVPYVKSNTLLREALLEITSKKFGMTVIVDDSMKIKGIFTDGDLRRICNANINFQSTPIYKVMTPEGIYVAPNMLIVDALDLMQKKKITTLMVADDKKLKGLIHIHDILRLRLV